MRVAVLGAGYAGLTLARKLQQILPDSVSLVVVDEQSEHLVQHELHRVVRRPSLAEEITVDLDAVLDCEIRQATVTDVDPDAGVATLDESETLSYDVGAVCLGAQTAFYDLPGVREHATPLKRLDDARAIRERFHTLSDGDRVVVGGAGLSGVQVAGELAEMREDSDIEIRLLEQEDAVAPSFPPSFQSAVHDALVDAGVTVMTGTGVAGADADAISLADGSDLPMDQFVWTGGIEGSPALDSDRPVVRADLRLGESTFAVGDAARVVDSDGEAVPASAAAAIREARVAADNIGTLVERSQGGHGEFQPRLTQYQFNVPGWLVSVGDDAVAKVGPSVLTGGAALALKTTVGAGYLGTVGAVQNAVDLVSEELDLHGEKPDSE
ncbi:MULTISPECIES: NAD(P)/FAD-dependent oxidoreductase [unclassified Haloarcula]|uniref:NAD(P)/FAD-dependent oxidoreductase n=1 Tax=unclassified Haloarcula TaxID=2624677 RepID=UPI000EF17C5F|nr:MULTISPECIES: FAD-dependent oxidoreductase [unclassified Haloarcula]RLM39149.1 NADH dehydrogenase FAD-containing subunit [Haloarcula sp. Atlit-120R]RLM47093.1 NADH dehydrogenase FAD-containing subunit [Haloarcula sp. Atlit-47R]